MISFIKNNYSKFFLLNYCEINRKNFNIDIVFEVQKILFKYNRVSDRCD